jgi:hypothetical protein
LQKWTQSTSPTDVAPSCATSAPPLRRGRDKFNGANRQGAVLFLYASCRVNKALKAVAPWFEPLTCRASSSSPTCLFFPSAAAPAIAYVRGSAPAAQAPSHLVGGRENPRRPRPAPVRRPDPSGGGLPTSGAAVPSVVGQGETSPSHFSLQCRSCGINRGPEA